MSVISVGHTGVAADEAILSKPSDIDVYVLQSNIGLRSY